MLYGIKYNMDVDGVRTILSKSDIWTIQNYQTDTIFCKDKSNTYYFDIYLENGSVNHYLYILRIVIVDTIMQNKLMRIILLNALHLRKFCLLKYIVNHFS